MSNKVNLIPETGTFYKANLHCHTIHSDGRLTPEEVKKAYMDEGVFRGSLHGPPQISVAQRADG